MTDLYVMLTPAAASNRFVLQEACQSMAKRAFQIRLKEDGPSAEGRRADDRADLETLSLVVSRAGNAILILDGEGHLQWANDAFTQLSGYELCEASGKAFGELLFGPSTSAKSQHELISAISAGIETTADVLMYRKDGTTFWTETKLIPVRDDDDELSRWIVLQTDISKRRQTEEALESAKESAEANSRSKSEFLANMSHEIRTPLNAILGMTELALTTDLTREQRDYLRTVKTSADTLLDLLNDVLDISKIEAGRMEIEEIEFNLAEVVRETLKALAVRAHEKGLELAVHMPMDIPHDLRGDPTRIRQVLFNLVGNAIKFTEQGEVIVDVEPQWQSDDEIGLQFSVTDTGIGIPKQRLRQIFESFTQVDSSMARRFGGSGLGLTITSELLRLMDGKIWVKSSLGKGSTFYFTLTLKLSDGPSRATSKLEQPELDGLRALIVDDNATNRQILEEMLGHWGMQPTLADGAASALSEMESAAREHRPFDLVLLDAMMPVIDGFQLAERILARPDLEHGTVMMLSSADRPNSTTKCRELGIATYLVKPISASALLEAILSTLGKQRQASAPRLSDQACESLLRQKTTHPLNVLLVDDHEPNRRLVESILLRRGHRVQSEADGDAAIRVCCESKYDVVLMDVQMPGRNGFSATRAIRQHEQRHGGHTPIVALTAHALRGDREKCLAAGMDAYLSKPIHADELIDVVERMGDDPKVDVDQTATPDIQQAHGFSIDAALKRMGGEQDLLIEHLGFVLSDLPQLISTMKSAVNAGDAKQLEIAAHRLKSLVSSYDHAEACELTQSLETDAKAGNLDRAVNRLEKLEPILQSFARTIDDYLQTSI
ncbi:response regulator [Stieleria sp.]|uniref:PAS domain-containing hybrid sensor histidine kinase/response regulator n=1 Tax=Stieleria sp. TaxID=2795976 RepID=UPI00356A6AB3